MVWLQASFYLTATSSQLSQRFCFYFLVKNTSQHGKYAAWQILSQEGFASPSTLGIGLWKMKEVIPYFLLSLFKWSFNLSHSKTSCRLCAQTIKHCHANGHTHKHIKIIGGIPGRVHWSIEEVKSTDTSNRLQFVWLEAITLAKLEEGIRNGIKRHLRHKLLKETKTGKIQHQVWELWKCADGNLLLIIWDQGRKRVLILSQPFWKGNLHPGSHTLYWRSGC